MRHNHADYSYHLQDVSIHAPVWGATIVWGMPFLLILFQSTHPCGVRRRKVTLKDAPISVSIHAPVWGATYPCPICATSGCFNPRTRVGCDVIGSLLSLPFLRFNPRTRVGCDPTKPNKPSRPKFQSTHPCGVRHELKTAFKRLMMFQSTHPCGVRHFRGW